MPLNSLRRLIWPFIHSMVLMLSPGLRVEAQSSAKGGDTAQLRCDPWTVIKAIDGQFKRVKAMQGGAFTDCEIPLSVGPHVLKVCFEGARLEMTGFSNIRHVYRCDEDRELTLDAAAGHIYRVRLKIEGDFSAWIEDVTAAEGALPASPTENKSRRVSKDQEQTMILVRVTGGDVPAFMAGSTQNKWFKASRLKQAFSGPQKLNAEADGFFTGTFSNGETIAMRYTVDGDHLAFVCDTQVPVYEDLPGGRVLYLGDYHFEQRAYVKLFSVTQDLEAARKFLQAHHPHLVEKLESRNSRSLGVPEPCVPYSLSSRLRQSPSAK